MGGGILGPLADSTVMSCVGPEGTTHTWNLPLDRHTFRSVLHVKAGDAVTVPYLGSGEKPTSLIGGSFTVHLALVDVSRKYSPIERRFAGV